LPEKPSDAELARAASDPSTPQATLADLAYDHPELRVAIAQNPSTYEGLLEWLGELDDGAIQDALSARGGQSIQAGPTPIAPSEQPEPAPAPAPSGGTCRSCSSPLRASANYCGNCGTFIPGRTPFSTVGDLSPTANRAVLYSSLAALAIIVLVVTGAAAAQTINFIHESAAFSALQSGSDSGDSSGSADDPSASSTEPTAKPTPTLPPLGVGFTADDPSLYSGLSGYGDDIDLRSPSGNIHCGIDLPTNPMGAAEGCYLDHYTYTPPQPNPCLGGDGTSDAAYGGLWTLDADGVGNAICYQGMEFGAGDNTARILPYGHTLSYGGYIFISESTGMSIVKISTRHGVKLNLSSWTEL
jgi:hypothetical protein